MSQAIKVVVRVRPFNLKQKQQNCECIANVDEGNNQISIVNPSEKQNIKTFAFDCVFNQESEQELVYSKTAFRLVENVLMGYNGTVFAYGQTGCGKTHSMIGKLDDPQLQGIIPRSFGQILSSIQETTNKEFLIRCSFIEIYNEEIRDLLSNDIKEKLEIKESPDKGVFIKDLSMNNAKTYDELMKYMTIGNKNRSVGETNMNKESSRSHLMFMLFLESADVTECEEKNYVASKLNLVDLAGSQRLSKTGAEGNRLKQAQKINLSLSALGNVISALVDGKSHHIPYRDSKLTRLLQDSLGGNTKTVMIANCSPADYNFDQTISTLRYASRAKFIKNKPIINEDPKDALLKEYSEEIKRLKEMISKERTAPENHLSQISSNSSSINYKLKNKEEELIKEKEETKMLMERISKLQKMHVEAKDIHIDSLIRETFQRASILKGLNFQGFQELNHPPLPKTEDQFRTLEVKDFKSIEDLKLNYKAFIMKYSENIKNLEFELKDLNRQNYADKQILLDDYRSLSKGNKLLNNIVRIMLSNTELEQFRQNCRYNEERQQFKIGKFILKQKQLIFPKLVQKNQLLMMNPLKDKVLRPINNISAVIDKIDKRKEDSLRGIINDARLISQHHHKQEIKPHVNRKIMLQPLRRE